MRKTGVIRKYFANRGLGFLAADEGVADLFFHVSDCLDDDADLIGGRRVEFEESRDRDGRRLPAFRSLPHGLIGRRTSTAASLRRMRGAIIGTSALPRRQRQIFACSSAMPGKRPAAHCLRPAPRWQRASGCSLSRPTNGRSPIIRAVAYSPA
jgi:cold shock CspA family protein